MCVLLWLPEFAVSLAPTVNWATGQKQHDALILRRSLNRLPFHHSLLGGWGGGVPAPRLPRLIASRAWVVMVGRVWASLVLALRADNHLQIERPSIHLFLACVAGAVNHADTPQKIREKSVREWPISRPVVVRIPALSLGKTVYLRGVAWSG